MKYQLEFLPRARRQLNSLPDRLRAEVVQLIIELQYEPRPLIAEPLRDQYAGVLKIKVDGWRIFYMVDDGAATVRVLNIKRRDRNTYLSLYSIFF